jgi:hypothetical protein
MNLTDEERQRRSEQALELHAQGKLGGAEFGRLGGRPRKPRANETIAELTAAQGKEIFARLFQIVQEGKDSDSIKSAVELLKSEELERKIQEQQEVKVELLKRDELLEMVANGFRELESAGILPGIIDGFAVEASDAEFEAVASNYGSAEEGK